MAGFTASFKLHGTKGVLRVNKQSYSGQACKKKTFFEMTLCGLFDENHEENQKHILIIKYSGENFIQAQVA